ncbi:MAG TPA: SDR family oxidoreductase [Bryobacteraceae bacterium]|nr:SDR family oxidoreductase [Bryobacteraceae bacterium]
MVLKERTAIVTGSGGAGCGRALALRLAREGAAVIVSDVDIDGGAETLRRIQASGGRAAFRRADMRLEAQVHDLVDFAAREFGPLGLLVNNATAPFAHGYDMDGWLRAVETDFVGPLMATRYAVEAMRQHRQGGAIVNISSISALWHGRRTPAAAPVYDAAKAGLLRLTTGLAEFAKADNIRVNCLAPGWIATEGPRKYWESLSPVERAERGVPARLLPTEEIAAMVVRLATDDSLAGRVVVWWSDEEPKLLAWGDRGYKNWEPFAL